jgi:hypothetical protein
MLFIIFIITMALSEFVYVFIYFLMVWLVIETIRYCYWKQFKYRMSKQITQGKFTMLQEYIDIINRDINHCIDIDKNGTYIPNTLITNYNDYIKWCNAVIDNCITMLRGLSYKENITKEWNTIRQDNNFAKMAPVSIIFLLGVDGTLNGHIHHKHGLVKAA